MELFGVYLFVVIIFCGSVSAYKPILALHGFAISESEGTFHDWDNISQWIAQEHPGQVFIPLNIFNGFESTRPLLEQVPAISQFIQQTISENETIFNNGYHFLGHSQGGLIMRVLLEVMDNHQVDTFVSLAGLQYGIYGLGFLNNYIQNLTDEATTDFLYTSIIQNEFSPANYWHAPYPNQNYIQDNIFLPVVNNENPGSDAMRYKTNFLRTKRYAFFGSPQDGTVVPWETTLWGFYDSNGQMVNITNQKIYMDDSFGLQSADKAGKLSLNVINEITHADWLSNRANFVAHVLPYLD